ncbi:MAG TPA: DUF47 family protein [Euryarchaeota archaeon]|nr:DUF47 family protein [Euryarchaeota archaeon]
MNEDGKRLIDRIFPPKYDFYGMLKDQADATSDGVRALIEWLRANDHQEPREIVNIEQKADELRHRMEDQLIRAFTTPFDRQEIYMISRQMDQILNFSMSTAIEMRAFGVETDKYIISMAENLLSGTGLISEAIRIMERSPEEAENIIRTIRKQEHDIEHLYIEAMNLIFGSRDAVEALRKREIYHHLKDAARNLSITVDILHRIIVSVA